jgi:DNA-binding transcriptional MerR regulator
MTIGEAAADAGVNVQTLRYYERRGLLPRPARRASGYRDFPPETVRTVRFVKRAQDLGFSLDEIAELLRLGGERRRDRQQVRAVATRRLDQVTLKIAELDAIRSALARLVHCCREGATLDCPIIDALEGAARAEKRLGQ